MVGARPAPQGEAEIFTTRLITHAGASTNKKDPPITSVLKKFFDLQKEALHGTPEGTVEACRAFLQDLVPVEIQAGKLRGVIVAQQKDKEGFASKQQALEFKVQQVKAEIQQKKRELEEARLHRQHLEEYEVVRALIAEETPRHVSMQRIAAVEQEIEALDAEAVKLEHTMERRKKQFALLFHCIEDLQRTQDDQEMAADAAAAAAEPQTMQVG